MALIHFHTTGVAITNSILLVSPVAKNFCIQISSFVLNSLNLMAKQCPLIAMIQRYESERFPISQKQGTLANI